MKTYIFRIKVGRKKKVVVVPESTIGRAERAVKERHKNARTIEFFVLSENSGPFELFV